MLSEMGVRSMIGGGGDGFGSDELGFLARDSRRETVSDLERELSVFRSGSAPPTVEGSLNAIRGLLDRNTTGVDNLNDFLGEDELLSSPEYLSYYYSNVNLNPRLPPPVLTKEDWRSAQRLQVGSLGYGGIGDMAKVSCAEERRSLFLQEPGFGVQVEHLLEPRNVSDSGEWVDKGDGLIGLSLGRQKSFADVLQADLGRKSPVPCYPSRPANHKSFASELDSLGSADSQFALNSELSPVNGLQKVVGPSSNTFASVVGSSLRRNTTPDAQLVARAPSPGLPPVGVRVNAPDRKANSSSSFNGASTVAVESDNLISSLSGLSLSNNGIVADDNFSQTTLQREYDEQHNFLFSSHSGQNNNIVNPQYPDKEYLSIPSNKKAGKLSSYPDYANAPGGLADMRSSKMRLNGLVESQISAATSANSFLNSSSGHSGGGSPAYHQNHDGIFTSYGLNAYAVNPALSSSLSNSIGTGNLPYLESVAAASLGIDSRSLGNGTIVPPNLAGYTDLQNFTGIGNQAVAAALQVPLNDPLYLQYLKAAGCTTQVGGNCNDLSMEGYIGNSLPDLLEVQKAYLGSLLQSQKQHNSPLMGKSGVLNHGHYVNPAFGLGMPYPASPLASPIASPVAPGSPLRLGVERNFRYPSGLRNLSGGVLGPWSSGLNGKMDGNFPSSLLEEFKSTKTRCFELAEIAGNVVEFSTDQYGSRFIQQKLETATTEEKDMVFEEIKPHVLSLMTDVFGNYVVQKFFEHGSAAQRRELAYNLIGHVLALSLQMYGCRVIQKAIEVVELDQKIKMVSELDGHVMRCVRDQNGNHVIQKCIECVPQGEIQFIISIFYDQVVTLSTHPYGCRVIQRVLEHCDDPKTQQIVMDEILKSVCMLAQDQYGNYVVQHVLEHGKPHERSEIIRKLAGQIVQMSQQKFASNVVEKCLTFGDIVERQILVNEMLGSTEENEPLQAMMKDQFANYVVQKVLETCDDRQRELILSRIKVHLNALKKYTYGKHIVARVEKLVAAGERRLGLQSVMA